MSTRHVTALASLHFPSPRILGGEVVYAINGPLAAAGESMHDLIDAARYCTTLDKVHAERN